MHKKLIISSSPHLRDDASTRRIMLDVCIALLPAALASVWFFGLRAALVIVLSVASAVFFEWFYCKAMKREIPVGDMSAVVTGLLLAYNLPSSVPLWVPVFGSAIAIVLVKQFYGGIGQNFMNPALAARAILAISFASIMTAWVVPQAGVFMQGMSADIADVASGATPLAAAAAGSADSYSLLDLFLGNIPGTLGETSKLALLIGAAYLFYRKVISWRIPVAFVGSVAVCYLLYTGFSIQTTLYQLLSGGLILGAFFMATDYASSPVTPVGQLIFGAGCGVLLFVFRALNPAMAEGCSFAILLMNVVAPLIERVTRPKTFGEVKGRA